MPDTQKPTIHPTPIDETRWQTALELWISCTGILVTMLASVMFLVEMLPPMFAAWVDRNWLTATGYLLFILVSMGLIYGGWVYQVTRLGYVIRRRQHRPATRQEFNRLYAQKAPLLTILVPSYKEEHHVVIQTLLSAALQEYPNRQVVLLIDDPTAPRSKEEAQNLEEARRLADYVQSMLESHAALLRRARNNFLARLSAGSIDPHKEIKLLASYWQSAASWFEGQSKFPIYNHSETLFVEQVLNSRQRCCLERAAELLSTPPEMSVTDLRSEYNRLASLFNCPVTAFERKAFTNLSKEQNKAMNLNSYIGMMGKHYHINMGTDGPELVEVSEENAELSIPAADFIIVLDADSILLPEYALRLIHLMQQPGNEHLAVIQTPYSSFPGATDQLERMAGATTDMMYIVHQGFTCFQATFWVGANALIRRQALQDIVVESDEPGFPVKIYIQDRTVIEDTESSVDLVQRGWQLFNYPERLTYSATPADFGSLAIQRRRWANGGLIIMPKLIRYLLSPPYNLDKMVEGVMRMHYLVSITLVNFGLLLMLAIPLVKDVWSIWLPVAGAMYYLIYCRDLVLSGYRIIDLFKVYALNLLLIPVNLAGVIKSVHQGLSHKKIPFGRTPKISERTAVSPGIMLSVLTLMFYLLSGGLVECYQGHYLFSAFALANAALLMYAIVVFIGFPESWVDLCASWQQLRTNQNP